MRKSKKARSWFSCNLTLIVSLIFSVLGCFGILITTGHLLIKVVGLSCDADNHNQTNISPIQLRTLKVFLKYSWSYSVVCKTPSGNYVPLEFSEFVLGDESAPQT